jgi:hypothetical protein
MIFKGLRSGLRWRAKLNRSRRVFSRQESDYFEHEQERKTGLRVDTYGVRRGFQTISGIALRLVQELSEEKDRQGAIPHLCW